MKDGDKITYIREDSGVFIAAETVLDDGTELKSGVQLLPGETLIVGLDIPVIFAERLCQDGICDVCKPKAPEAKADAPDAKATKSDK